MPYAFYKEFQVKTGGYSVEFGRTTGGVINAVTRSGTNNFEFGSEVAWQPRSLQSNGKIHPNYVNRYDDIDLTTADVYAGGPIVRDKLFFFALYEFRDYNKRNTNDAGGQLLQWQVGLRILGRKGRLADQRQESAGAAGFLRQGRPKQEGLRVRSRLGERAVPTQNTEFEDRRRTQLGRHLYRPT